MGDSERPNWMDRMDHGRFLGDVVALMTEHGMTRTAAVRAVARPELIPENIKRIVRQSGSSR